MNFRKSFFAKISLSVFVLYLLIASPKSCLAQKPLYKGQTKFLGSGMYRGKVPDDFLPGFNRYFNAQYIEGIFWNRCEPERGHFVFQFPKTWADPQGQYDWARQNRKIIYAHALTWSDGFMPKWWWGLPENEKREELEEWIATALKQFKGAKYVNVLNEGIHATESPTQKLTYIKHIYGDNELYGTGYDWAVWIFEMANKHKTRKQKLIINDCTFNPEGLKKFVELCTVLHKRGLIDGIGIQGHHASWRNLTNEQIIERIDQIAAVGSDIYITEFDVEGIEDEVQLKEMQRVFPILWNYKKVKGFVFYDWRENHCWKKNAFLVRADGTERPALQWVRTYLQGKIHKAKDVK